ncbi:MULTISPECIES: hypothetical protein [Sodalis]|uniref:Multiple stress resistance protein BhsA n=1 Tax=Sodalis ligni TaxID=2697027 RepID=A0A4R1NJK7_9GAMM|nr:hypothetical protein [Sodalis ligni]TCL06121.1 hypothetical protein EZJ58_4353 [Sodalis ligni]
MRKVKAVSLAIVLGALSFGSSAMQITTQGTGPAQDTAVSASAVLASSANGALNEKAVPDGTRSYPMTSVAGQRNMHSTSVVYE